MSPDTTPSAARRNLSESQEDYLKQILVLGAGGSAVTTRALADRLGVRAASVTGMVQRLADRGLVEYVRYRGVRLTGAGRRVALEMVRHHRLLEAFLATALGYDPGEVHEEAERLEHAISERIEERIAELLGHPTTDPHGAPIPDADLVMPGPEGAVALDAVRPGERVTVEFVEGGTGTGPELEPGAAVEVVAVDDGVLTWRLPGGDSRRRLGRIAAERIRVYREVACDE